MENSPYPSDIHNKVNRVLRKTNNKLSNKEVVCACYLYSFLKYHNGVAFQRFKWNFKNLTDEGKRNVVSLYLRLQNKEKVNSKIKKR